MPVYHDEQVIHAIESQVDTLADRLLKAGKITDTHKQAGFYQRQANIPQTHPLLLAVLPQTLHNTTPHPSHLPVFPTPTQDVDD